MGCDIHLYTEIKIKGRWHAHNHPDVNRNYDLFAKMAGVRSRDEIKPIVQPRGFPKNASFIARLDYKHWGRDAHSASYLNQKEIKILAEWCERQPWGKELFWFEHEFGYLFGNTIYNLRKYKEDYPKGIEDVRFVFWFDN